MEKNTRFTGQPKRLYDFMDTFDVHCPECSGHATVQVPFFLDYKKAELKCNSCHFSENISNRKRYILTGKAKCIFCLELLQTETEGKKKIPKTFNIRCTSCKKMNTIKENWTEIFLKYNTDGICDPAFGLPLWFTGNVKGNLIWAYNRAHLEEIKDYVSSKLRERSTNSFKMTMVEKLPDFIKLASNREEVLKALDRMLKKQ
jgi:hypothetical protein